MRWVTFALAFAELVSQSGCLTSRPDWFRNDAQRDRAGAYDYFLVASGSGDGRDRAASCEAADESARSRLLAALTDFAEEQSDVVAACGGPSRLRECIVRFGDGVFPQAPRTREEYSDSGRTCYVELRWLIPRHLPEAIKRVNEISATEEEVAEEFNLVWNPDRDKVARDATPEKSTGQASTLTPAATLERIYPGWFYRVLVVDSCPTHVVAFVGAPGGTESRWLELKQTATGWLVVDDQRAPDSGWPFPPTIGWCD